jgi:hypothetical protein
VAGVGVKRLRAGKGSLRVAQERPHRHCTCTRWLRTRPARGSQPAAIAVPIGPPPDRIHLRPDARADESFARKQLRGGATGQTRWSRSMHGAYRLGPGFRIAGGKQTSRHLRRRSWFSSGGGAAGGGNPRRGSEDEGRTRRAPAFFAPAAPRSRPVAHCS